MDSFLELLKTHGFWATLLWSLIETDFIFLLVGAFGHAGVLHLYSCFPAAIIGALLHDVVVYWLAHNRAEWIRNRSIYKALGPKIERLTSAVGYWELALCRPLYGTRYPSLIFWGLQKLSYTRLLIADGIGLLIWASVLTWLGYLFGDHLETLKAQVIHFQQWLLAGVVLIGAVLMVRQQIKKRRLERKRQELKEERVPTEV